MKNPDLLTESYSYELPQSFIADRPALKRDESKLLVYNSKTDQVVHTQFKNLPEFLSQDDLLVLNNSKVFPCRLLGEKTSGGKIEIFLLSLVAINGLYPVMIKSNSKKKIGDQYLFDKLVAELKEITLEGDFLVEFNLPESQLLDYLENHAKVPIPPYIRQGESDEKDKSDYQTIYADKLGSVAAPTAGLHFTENVFKSLADKGIKRAFVNLQVGAGTFKPVSSEIITEHHMHKEYFEITEENLEIINQSPNRIAVGTTSLRVLESSYLDGKIQASNDMSSTEIFLYPGVEVNSIKGLITNFHLPKSTLLMLVSSLIGREKTLELYEIAKKENYRFFSYGDAMLILR